MISIHAPRVGSDHIREAAAAGSDISIHAPRVGSDFGKLYHKQAGIDFNPRSPCGERPFPDPGDDIFPSLFQSTLPVWGATSAPPDTDKPRRYFNPRSPCGERRRPWTVRIRIPYFNPRSPCGERLAAEMEAQTIIMISIHAPRVGSDCSLPQAAASAAYFNPRSPCGERRRAGTAFLARWNFNPRSPCGERHLRSNI